MTDVWQGVLKKEFGKTGIETKVSLSGQTKKRDKSQNHPLRQGALSEDLRQSKEKEIEVDFEFDQKGAVFRVRRRGKAWEEPAAPVTQPPRQSSHRPQRGPAAQSSAASAVGDFFNPYNFIPAPPPEKVQGERETHPLGRFAPVGHDRWRKDYFSGTIDIEITAKTPLLIPDTLRVEIDGAGHHTLPLLVDADGRPVLRPTSLKGCLRSAFEAVTNSRFGVFQGHDAKLARRMHAGEGLAMVPARIGDNGVDLELFLGSHAALGKKGYPVYNRNGWQPAGTSEMYAAWLPRYRAGNQSNLHGPVLDRWRQRYPSGGEPEHGDEVRVWVRRIKYQRESSSFEYWRVEHIQLASSTALWPSMASVEAESDLGLRGNHHPVPGSLVEGWGYVCITGQNIGRKHDERVFFVPTGRSAVIEKINPVWIDEWKQLVRDYRDKAKRDLDKRANRRPPVGPTAYLGREPGQTAFSRHVYENDATTLEPGDLCYARFDQSLNIVGLYPVMIARELGGAPPEDFLPDELKPATSRDKMSPADRVFGWVRQTKWGGSAGTKGAWRGQLRIESVRCDTSSEQAVTRFPSPGLPLAILSTPKPEQARFYLAADREGTPFKSGASRDEVAYKRPGERGLRGRKVYPHHAALPADYWSDPLGTKYTEYKRAGDGNAVRDDQNRSILGWVNAGTTFAARIAVTNLSPAELGALIWLLDLPEGCFHRIGGGKPLGFGSVRMTVKALDLLDGESIKSRYGTLLPAGESGSASSGTERDASITSVEQVRGGAIAAFKDAVSKAYGNFEDVHFIKAFLNTAKGFNKRVHYPRSTREPDPEGKNYKWFVGNNDKTRRLALDELWAPRGLPLMNEKGKRPDSTG